MNSFKRNDLVISLYSGQIGIVTKILEDENLLVFWQTNSKPILAPSKNLRVIETSVVPTAAEAEAINQRVFKALRNKKSDRLRLVDVHQTAFIQFHYFWFCPVQMCWNERWVYPEVLRPSTMLDRIQPEELTRWNERWVYPKVLRPSTMLDRIQPEELTQYVDFVTHSDLLPIDN